MEKGTEEVEGLKKQLEDSKQELTVAPMRDCEKATQLRFATLPDLQGRLPKESAGEEAAEAAGMLHERVTRMTLLEP